MLRSLTTGSSDSSLESLLIQPAFSLSTSSSCVTPALSDLVGRRISSSSPLPIPTHGQRLECEILHSHAGLTFGSAMVKEKRAAKLPTQQLFVLAICRFAEPVAMTSVFPYLVSAFLEEGATSDHCSLR